MIHPGYQLLDVARPVGRGGGVGLIIRDNIHVKKQKIAVTITSYECLEVLLNAGSCFVRVLTIYRPPSSGKSGSSSATFLEEFTYHLDHLCTSSGQLLVLGDFNFHYDQSSHSDVKAFKDVLDTFSLVHHVTDPTHRKGHILDLVMTREEEMDIQSMQNHGPVISDHSAIYFSIPCKLSQPAKRTFTHRKTRAINLIQFNSDILASDFYTSPATTLDEAVHQYNSVLTGLLDKHAPELTKPLRTRPSVPWFSTDIKAMKTKCRQAERRWRKHPLTIHLQLYQQAYQEYRKMCTAAKKSYYHQKIQECEEDQKALYSMANQLMFKGKSTTLPSHTEPQDMAQQFAQFFNDKIEKIRDEIRHNQRPGSPDEQIVVTPPQMDSFAPVSEEEMKKIIIHSNSKCCSLDPIPTSLLKNCLDSLIPIICNIINLSLQTSCVPNNFKNAIVTPLIKKQSLDKENFKNYRPVSNLSFISKLLEKVVMSRINKHLDEHNLREPCQSAYRAGHSTETALVKVYDDMLCAVDDRQYVLLVLLDLSAAFDTIDHDAMIQRLKSLFGINGNALAWMESYFSERTQYVVIGKSASTPFALSTGIPQGSVAGPGTFPAYTQPIGSVARQHGVNMHLYADDTQLYIGCHLEEHQSTQEQLEACVADVRRWMAENMLKLNDAKTEYIVIGSRYMLRQVPESLQSIRVGEKIITATPAARNIGVVVDSALSMEQQVTSVCRACYVGLRDVARIRPYLTDETTEKLIVAFVTSKLDCNNALLYKISKSLQNKLQIVQNNAARVIVRKKKHESIENTRKVLHWLPIEFRIQYKINLLTFKCLNNLAPIYLQELLHPYKPTRNLRSADKGYLKENKSRTAIGDRAFRNAAPVLWNRLPEDVRAKDTLPAFKTALKTFLFQQAF